jgi:myo-inositol-1(or 4)-monophosphatase
MQSRLRHRSFRNAAVAAARAGARVLLRYFAKEFRIDYKGEVNLVTEADRAAEAMIVGSLHRRFPGHQILAEESGEGTRRESPYKWIIDPLDGTTNFAHTYPVFCVSIALEVRDEVVLGVVYDPIRKELFIAEKGRGAILNDKPIHVSKTEKLNDSLLVTGFAYDVRREMVNNLDHFGNFSLRARGVRRTGSAALDLCYVACGRFDGFWEMRLAPWDTAAGFLIATESGARVTDFSGRPFNIYRKEIVASNGKIHREMIEVLQLSRR